MCRRKQVGTNLNRSAFKFNLKVPLIEMFTVTVIQIVTVFEVLVFKAEQCKCRYVRNTTTND